MANSPQAKKRIRSNDRRMEANRKRRSRIRTHVKQVELAIEAGDKKAALEAFKAARPEIDRGVTKGVYHRNTASRKISRLEHRINSLAS
ncbi:MAG: 30S ribosomal protein S20 [Proteobacteria bacterium]|nr:30S ribosomal protein S20 [Pseudomonadota bacterium]MCH8321926.1 30S ribosomal protein S20 [Pseudomonadota bacterium]